jgi:putative DNA primase/helicase
MRDDSSASDNIDIIAMGRCPQRHHFLELQIVVGGRRRRHILSMQEFEAAPDRVIASLEAGLVTSASRTDFRRRVQEKLQTLRPTFRVATRPGWYRKLFVLPSGRVFGHDPVLRVCLPEIYREFGDKFASCGTLPAWQRIAKLAIGNSRLTLAVALAFTGPVASLLKVEPPSIQLVGMNGAGKTAILTAAGSVWGGRDDDIGTFAESWAQTKNKVDVLAAAHSGAFLALDDTRTFERDTRVGFGNFKEAVMRMAEGRLKGRHGDTGAPVRWRTPFLSSSNDSQDDMARAVGDEIDDALRGRLIDVPLPAGIVGAFEDLHDFADHAAFSVELLRVARQNYGVASVEFIQRMVEWCEQDEARLVAWLQARREAYLRLARRRVRSTSRDLTRFHQRFATIYAAGALAIELRVLPWNRQILGQTIIACELAHVSSVEESVSSGAAQVWEDDPLERLKAHVGDRGGSFVDLQNGLIGPDEDHDHNTCDGYVNERPDGTLEFLFSEAKVQEVCGGKAGALQAKAQLADWLVRDGARPSTRRTIWATGTNRREQVLAICAEFFDGAGEATRRRHAIRS